jgi:uncharacterized SAM-binding protein YcdF (DUF218 family)
MFTILEWLLTARERQPTQPNVIVPLGYGLTKRKILANGTFLSLLTAFHWWRRYPKSVILFANSSHSFEGSADVESTLKWQEILLHKIPMARIIDAGPIVNTVTEAKSVKRVLEEHFIRPVEILLITDSLHGQSAIYIWERVFPSVRISLQYMHSDAYQPDHIFPGLQGKWAWLMTNVKRQAALLVMGMEWVATKSHKA